MSNNTEIHIDTVMPDAVCGICYHACEDSETCNRTDCPNKNADVSSSSLNDWLCVGVECNFKNQPEKLKYIGKNWSGNGYWHQFEKVGIMGVWCELLDTDLHMIEKTLDT